MSQVAFDLLCRMLEYDPDKRITAEVRSSAVLIYFLMFIVGSIKPSVLQGRKFYNKVSFCWPASVLTLN